MKLMLVFQPHIILPEELYQKQILEYLIVTNSVDVTARYFNHDLLQVSPKRLLDCSKEYVQVVNEATHISGSQLDLVYMKNTLLDEFDVNAKVQNISMYKYIDI